MLLLLLTLCWPLLSTVKLSFLCRAHPGWCVKTHKLLANWYDKCVCDKTNFFDTLARSLSAMANKDKNAANRFSTLERILYREKTTHFLPFLDLKAWHAVAAHRVCTIYKNGCGSTHAQTNTRQVWSSPSPQDTSDKNHFISPRNKNAKGERKKSVDHKSTCQSTPLVETWKQQLGVRGIQEGHLLGGWAYKTTQQNSWFTWERQCQTVLLRLR